MTAAVLSLMVLAVIVLTGGAIWLRRRGTPWPPVVLMLVLAAVIAGNLAIWTLPLAGSPAPLAPRQ